jgi:pterin-4a-carbinolamine dehydratase
MTYKVTYYFVDDTYWDDGNRTTSRNKEFKTYDQAVDFAKEIVAKGTRETSRQTGKTQDFRVDKSSVLIEEIVISVTRYPWWVVLDDSDYITNKIKGHLKHDNFKALAEFEKEVIGHYDATKFKTLLSKAKESKE